MSESQTAAGRYQSYEMSREPFLRRAREAAKLTIPSLLPDSGHTSHTKLYTPFQSLGARGVNNLSSKMLLAVLPSNGSFFRLDIDEFTLEKMTQQEGMKADVEEALGKIERVVMSYIDSIGLRVTASEALKHYVTTGNGLLYLPEDGGAKFFAIDKYVVRRDPMGFVLEIIVKECVAPESLPSNVRNAIESADPDSKEKTVDLYTRIYFDDEDDKWHVYQEVKGEKIDGTEGSYQKDKSPWIPLRFSKIDGEDYGRGYVEEYIGDLKSLEALSQCIVEGSAVSAKVLMLVDPNGTTDIKTISQSENGAVRNGKASDVSVLQVQKGGDFQIAFKAIENIESRISFAFMLNTAVQRGGERVTAEEIRYVAGELEDSLGGVYSILSQEFQLPLVKRLMYQLEKAKRIPALPKGTVSPTIVTGLEALGRGHDLNRLNTFLGSAMQTLGPQVVAQYLNVTDYMTRMATALGLDTKGLIKSQEDIQAEQQAAQQQAMQQQMSGMLAQGGMDMAKEAVKQGAIE